MTLPLELGGIGDSYVRRALEQIAQQFPLAVNNIGFALLQQLGLNLGTQVGRGAVSISAAESTSATSYAIGNLTTPDRVSGVVLPTNGLIVLTYQALWQNTVANNARAAVFLGANQLKIGVGTGAPVVQEISGPTELNDDGLLFSSQNGLQRDGGVGAATEVTTGQIVGTNSFTNGGPIYIFAAAGTYDVSVQFKNQAAGTSTVKNRHLWVETRGF